MIVLVITFGEILLRLNNQGHNRLFQNKDLNATFCGSEANVSVALSNLGLESYFVSKIPDNDVGIAALRTLNYFGVNTTHSLYGGERLGIYFLEKGASQRPSKVIYDRKNSSIAQAADQEFDWESIFQGQQWFHFSGINPALSDTMKKITLQAVKQAKHQGLKVSCDLNYRGKLWTKEQANKAMVQLMPYVDVLLSNEKDIEDVLGIKAKDATVETGTFDKRQYSAVAQKVKDAYDLDYIGISLRKSVSASHNKWSGLLYSAEANQAYYSNEYAIDIVDRVGSGDSFAAGIIYSLINNYSPSYAVEFAAAASCLKHTIEGDFNRIDKDEVVNLMQGDATGRVKR